MEQDISAEKLYTLTANILCAVAGINSDASILINNARVYAQRYLKTYNEEIQTEQLVRWLADIKQGYTQHGGLRPYGVSLLYAGYDEDDGFKLFMSNPSGNYSGWKATSIGSNNSTAQTVLKQEFKEDLSLKDAVELGIKVLSKTMDSSVLASEKIEFATIGKNKNGEIVQKIWTPVEIDTLIKETGLAPKTEEE